MHWILLTLAILAEVAGTTTMKLSEGFSRLTPSLLLYASSLTFLNFALKGIEVSIAYAIWSGLGTAIVVIIGILIFSEPLTLLKTISIILIIAGVIGLNLGGGRA